MCIDSRLIRAARMVAAAAGLWVGGCSGGEAALGPTKPHANGPTSALADPPVQLLTVSNPVIERGVAALNLAGGGAGLAYVSFPPGTFPGVVSAMISNPRTASSLTASVVDGGLDPVGIPAAAGDTLQVVTYASGGVTSDPLHAVVPAELLPTVVRTQPPWVRDSPKLLTLPSFQVTLIVFSEPMDPASVNNNTIQLLQNGTPVSGTVALAPDGLSATFETAAPLSPVTVYTLVVGPGLTDLDGDSLEQFVERFSVSIDLAGGQHLLGPVMYDPGPAVLPGDRWLLTLTTTSISGPSGVTCWPGPIGDIGTSYTTLMAVQRSGQSISFVYDIAFWPIQNEGPLDGTVTGNDFTAAMTQDLLATDGSGPPQPIPATCSRLVDRYTENVSGHFENADSMVGEDVQSYRLTSGEWVSAHFDWRAVPSAVSRLTRRPGT